MADHNITVHRLKDMTDAEIEHFVAFNTKAYEGDSSMQMLLGGNWNLSGQLARAMLVATLLEGQVYVAKGGDRIVATGLWFRPGTELFGTEKQRAASGFYDFLNMLTPEFQNWYSQTYPDTLKREELFTDEELARRWWCSNLVTDPEFQGRGYGKAIIRAVEQEKAKEKGEFIALATAVPLNVEKYHSMGFADKGAFELESPLKRIKVHVLYRS
ncbi:hypothetical protein V5O48_015030 [Marasmius crinis-equi]|uniref:N-acetyltransferase domain-containing protein n=1 Tax=Marasmius crinis-equi TaxID=585013 RepID=A0ABR3EVY9_9AGAR